LQIVLQDKYNIGILTVNMEFMWLDTKRMERLAKTRLSPVSKLRHMNSIFTDNTPISYIHTVNTYHVTTQDNHIPFKQRYVIIN
jgi:hypothetical protein